MFWEQDRSSERQTKELSAAALRAEVFDRPKGAGSADKKENNRETAVKTQVSIGGNEKRKLALASHELGNDDPEIKKLAKETLIAAGAAALPYLREAVTSDDPKRSTEAWIIIERRYRQYLKDVPFKDALHGWQHRDDDSRKPMQSLHLFANVARLASVDDETAKARLQEIAHLKAIINDPKNQVLTDEDEKTARTVLLDKHRSDYEKLANRKSSIQDLGAQVGELNAWSPLKDEALAMLVDACPNLTTIDLGHPGCYVTDRGLGEIAKLRQLEHLSIDGRHVTDDGLKQLEKMKPLKSLDLHLYGPKITDEGLGHIKGLSNLESLDLIGARVTGNALSHLAGMKKLQTLNLDVRQFTDDSVKHLSGLSSLEQLLVLRNTRDDKVIGGFTDKGVQDLARLSNLRSLMISSSAGKLSDEGIHEFVKLTKLKSLDVSGDGITDKSLADLATLKDLQYLELGGTKITPEGAKKLHEALPKCRFGVELGRLLRENSK